MVDPAARVADDVEIGPFCTIGPDVEIGPGNRLLSHVVVTGPHHDRSGQTRSIPSPSSVARHKTRSSAAKSRGWSFGNRNILRESVTIHVGTALGGGVTRVGDGNLLMVNCHIGHDCQIASKLRAGQNVMLAGHVCVGSNVVMSGAAACHHYVTIGDYAFIAGMARIHHDVPPFVKCRTHDRIRALQQRKA